MSVEFKIGPLLAFAGRKERLCGDRDKRLGQLQSVDLADICACKYIS